MAGTEFLDEAANALSIGLANPAPEVLLTPNIGVIGVGGAGGNAVNNMVNSQLNGVSFYVANTDAQALSRSLVTERIQLGVTLTQGLGAGANPEVGRAAAEETVDKITECLRGLHLLFITAGMGGGTGTGAAPVIARIAKELGILTVGVVSKPFQFEGSRRMRTADSGILELKKHVDTLIVIPNQNLFRIVSNTTTFSDAFKIADDVLCQGVRSVTDLIVNPGMINLDFADVRTVLSSMGRAMMGTGEASGENRAEEAVDKAISNPLLDDSSIRGAKSVLLNIAGGLDLTLAEVDLAAERIRNELGEEDANIIFGTCADESLQGKIRISIVATGIEESIQARKEEVLQKEALSEQNVTVVDVPQTQEVSQTQENSTQEQLQLIQDLPQNEKASFESVVRENEQPVVAKEGLVTVVQEEKQPQTQLFQEEVPVVSQPIEVKVLPDETREINLDGQKSHENVKPIKGGLFDFFKGPKAKDVAGEHPVVCEAQKQNRPEDPNFSDPFENVDLPAFLRRG